MSGRTNRRGEPIKSRCECPTCGAEHRVQLGRGDNPPRVRPGVYHVECDRCEERAFAVLLAGTTARIGGFGE